MKHKVILMIFCVTFSILNIANTNIDNKSNENLKKCSDQLKEITNKELKLNNINKNEISLNSIENNKFIEIIQIFVSSDGDNGGAVLGTVKIDKKNKKIYDITNDEENNIPIKLDENYSFFNMCIY